MEYALIKTQEQLIAFTESLTEDIRELKVKKAATGKKLPFIIVSCIHDSIDSSYYSISVIEMSLFESDFNPEFHYLK